MDLGVIAVKGFSASAKVGRERKSLEKILCTDRVRLEVGGRNVFLNIVVNVS